MIWSAFKISIMVVSCSTVIVAAVGILVGALLARVRIPFKELIDSIITLPMVLPPTVLGYYMIALLGRNGVVGGFIYQKTGWSITFTMWAAVLACIVVSLPIMVKSARAAIEHVDQRLEVVSYTLGKSPIQTFFLITLPLALKSLGAGLVLSFARALGEFGATLMIAGNIEGKTQTMPLAIYEAVSSGDDKSAATLALVLTIFSVGAIYLTNVLLVRPSAKTYAKGSVET